MKHLFATVAAAVCSSVLALQRVSVEAPTKNLTEYRELASFAKDIGATHLGACQVEPSLWQWDEYGRTDPYPNWSMHRPSIFKFVVPPELAPYIPADYAKRNLDTLKARFAILTEFGLKATFDGMEPAYLPETIPTGAVPPASIRVVRATNTSRRALTMRSSARST